MAKVSQKIDGKGSDRGLASSKMAEPAVRLLTVACTGAKHSKPCGQRSDDAMGVLKQKSQRKFRTNPRGLSFERPRSAIVSRTSFVGGLGSPRANGTALLVGIVLQAGYRQIFEITNEFARLRF